MKPKTIGKTHVDREQRLKLWKKASLMADGRTILWKEARTPR